MSKTYTCTNKHALLVYRYKRNEGEKTKVNEPPLPHNSNTVRVQYLTITVSTDINIFNITAREDRLLKSPSKSIYTVII